MAGRRERCSWCRVHLLVPPEAQSSQCPVCRAVTRIPPNNPLGQAQDSIYQATNWVKGFIKTVSSNINTMATSTSTYPMPGTYDYGHRPQRILPPPLLLPFSAHGTKRALLCGVSYYGRSYKLKGSVNDVRCMKFLLVERLGFPSESILVLTGIYKPTPSCFQDNSQVFFKSSKITQVTINLRLRWSQIQIQIFGQLNTA